MPRTTVKSNSSDQPGFSLKLAFREYLFELSAQGTLVALAFVTILGLGCFGLWQHSQMLSGSSTTAKTTETQK